MTFSLTPPSRRETLAATQLHPDLEPWQGVLIEAWLTFNLVCTIQGATNARRKGHIYMPTIIIGCAVTVGAMTGVIDVNYTRHLYLIRTNIVVTMDQ